jgi:hypothetical protein
MAVLGPVQARRLASPVVRLDLERKKTAPAGFPLTVRLSRIQAAVL